VFVEQGQGGHRVPDWFGSKRWNACVVAAVGEYMLPEGGDAVVFVHVGRGLGAGWGPRMMVMFGGT
jgi:hypothetical protein